MFPFFKYKGKFLLALFVSFFTILNLISLINLNTIVLNILMVLSFYHWNLALNLFGSYVSYIKSVNVNYLLSQWLGSFRNIFFNFNTLANQEPDTKISALLVPKPISQTFKFFL